MQRPDRLLMLPGQGLTASAESEIDGNARCIGRSVRRMFAKIAASPESDFFPD